MEKKYYFIGENAITESDNKGIILTSHRIRYQSSNFGKAHIVSIMLEKISSIEIHYKSSLLTLIIGIILTLSGIVMGASNQGEAMILGLGIGLFFVLLYFITRRHVITIASDGGSKINFETKGMKRETILDFINKIETAKNNRTIELR